MKCIKPILISFLIIVMSFPINVYGANMKMSYSSESMSAMQIAPFPETVLYDSDGILIKAIGLTNNSDTTDVNLQIENNSNTTIGVSMDYVIINNIMTVCAYSYDVAPGKTAMADYPLDSEELEHYGFNSINSLSLLGYVYNAETGSDSRYFYSGEIVTELGTDYELPIPLDSFYPVYDTDSMTVYYTGVIQQEEEDSYEEYSSKALFFLYNKTNDIISFSPEDVAFDGVMDYTNYYGFGVCPNSFSEFYVTSEGNINDKNEVSFHLYLTDYVTGSELSATPEIMVNLQEV